MKKKKVLSSQILLICLLFGVTTFAQSPQANLAYAPCQEVPDLIENYTADLRSINRFYIVENSPEKRERLVKLYQSYLTKLGVISFDKLAQECKVDYILIQRDLNEGIRLAKDAATDAETVKQWFAFAQPIYDLEKARRRGEILNAQQVALDMNEMNKKVISLKGQLADATLSQASIRSAMETIRGLKTALKTVFDFYNGYDPLFTWWVPKIYSDLDTSLSKYSAVFSDKRGRPDKNGIIARKPAGYDEMVRLLEYEMIPYKPEELIEMANKEFAWCEKEMLKASREMGFGDDWKAALEKVKKSYVPPGEQPAAMVKLYNESVNFLKKNDLITIPELEEETWGLQMMSAQRQRTNAFFTGGNELTVSYPTNTMDIDFRMMSMRGNNPYFSRSTVHHELIAGHNMQYYMSDRYRTYRRFSTPFWMEGWALYWELLLWDMKFPVKPEEKVGMLFWRMHRCARIMFSFNFHLGKWTPQQCIDFLVDKVGHEYANAESEIRGPLSSNSNPLYQIAYLTGGFQFYALKKEMVDSGKMTYKQFHDAVIHLNAMPVEMIRSILENRPLQKDYKANWRF